MGMGFKFQMGMEWDGNEVIETGGNWYEKSVPAHLYSTAVILHLSSLIRSILISNVVARLAVGLRLSVLTTLLQ